MRISDSRRVLFVHVQKTAGSTVRNVLDEQLPDTRRVRGQLSGKHLTLSQILHREPELVDYWTFGFVRNPWDRMVSWWSMICDRRDAVGENERVARKMAQNPLWKGTSSYPDFETFVTRGTREFEVLRTPQSRYLSPRNGRRADFIGRQETFDADFRAVLARLDCPPSAADVHVNQSRRGPYQEYYTPATRDLVGELYERDCEIFGYEF